MKFSKRYVSGKLNQTGVIHHIIPIAAFIVLFGAVGAYFIFSSQAATYKPNQLLPLNDLSLAVGSNGHLTKVNASGATWNLEQVGSVGKSSPFKLSSIDKTYKSDGNYKIKNISTGKCLQAASSNYVYAASCSASGTNWVVDYNGIYFINVLQTNNKGSVRMLVAPYLASGNDTHWWPYNGANRTAEQWSYNP